MDFRWDQYRVWRPKILSLLANFIGKDVLDRVKRNPPQYFVSDNITWIDDAVWACRSQVVDCKQALAEILHHRFEFIIAFHGTRAESENSFRKLGLLPCDPQRLRAVADEIFERKELINERAADCFTGDYAKHNAGKVFFCLTEKELIEFCCHYMLYGSELLGSVGAALGEKARLRARGRAMLIECRVPVKLIPPDFMEGLAGDILAEIFEKYCTKRTTDRRGEHFGFWITETLKPEFFVKIHYPKQIIDPFDRTQIGC